MKRIITTLFLIVFMLFVTTAYAEIYFEVEKTEWHDKTVYDIKDHIIHGPGNNYDWSKDEDISTIDFMPEPNITVLSNGYISVRKDLLRPMHRISDEEYKIKKMSGISKHHKKFLELKISSSVENK